MGRALQEGMKIETKKKGRCGRTTHYLPVYGLVYGLVCGLVCGLAPWGQEGTVGLPTYAEVLSVYWALELYTSDNQVPKLSTVK